MREADLTLDIPAIYQQVKSDYEKIRQVAATNAPTKTTSGVLLEIRTKGQKGSSTYAFYARKPFVNILLGITK